MGKPNHATEAQVEKKRRPEVEKPQPQIQDNALQMAGIDPAILYNGGTVESQATALNHLQPVQRQAAVEHINQTQGNRHVQKVVSVMTAPGETAENATPAAQPAAKQPESALPQNTGSRRAATPALARPGGLLQEIPGLPPLPEALLNTSQPANLPQTAAKAGAALAAPAAAKSGSAPGATPAQPKAAPAAAKPAAPQPTAQRAPLSAPPARPPARAPIVQAKLSVSEPGDPFELEAERTADEVMRMPGRATPPEDPKGNSGKEKGPALHRSAEGGGVKVTSQIESGIENMKGGGLPLPSSEREFFEPRMGVDLSNVRIHTDNAAIQMNRDLQAQAFTVGSNIAFNSGKYEPGTPQGRHLMAHELTHVVQQGGAGELKRRPQKDDAAPETKEAAAEVPGAQRRSALLQRKPAIQREAAAGAASSDAPTPEEKAAAAAAAQAAEIAAAQARTEGIAATGRSYDEKTVAQAAGEEPRQKASASLAEGPVQKQAEEARQAETATTAQTLAAAAGTAKTAATQSALTAALIGVQTAAQQAMKNAATKAAATATAEATAKAAEMSGKAGAAGGAGGGKASDAATAAAKAAVEQAHGKARAAAEQTPKTAQDDPGYQNVKTAAETRGKEEQTHEEAAGKAAAAQDAVESPSSEIESQAQSNQVNTMESTETPGFDAAAFKAQLMERIAALAPSTSEQADNFKENGTLNGAKADMQTDVDQNRDSSVGPLEQATQAGPDTGSVQPRTATPLTPEDPGAAPSDIGAKSAVPQAKSEGELETPLQESSTAIDQQMADAEITEEQLQKSNEPEFTNALDAKKQAQTDAATTPGTYRQFEEGRITSAEAEAVAAAQAGLDEMHAARTDQFTQVQGQQEQTKTEDEQARIKIATDIQTIYADTKTEVESILSGLDAEVNRIFDAGAAEAKTAFENYVDAKMEAYKQNRYGGLFGWAQWIADKVLGMPGEVNAFYTEGRQLYLDKMDAVIDNIVEVIGTTLAKAKASVANGKKKIQDYVDQLPEDLRKVGEDAAAEIQTKFDDLTASIDAKQNELIDTLANKYQENLQAIDARIEEMKAANKGLIDQAIDALGGVIKTILELKDMLLSILAKAANAVMLILKDPIGFLSNLIQAVKQGFLNFVANIGTHLQKGFMEWLFGAVAETGIQLPKQFDLQGILDLVLQVLGLTWANIRTRAVKILGEPVVKALETAFEMFKIIQEQGLGGLWEYIKEQLGNLQEMVVDGIKEMVISQVIEAGIQWLIGILGGPAGAFIKAAKAIVDVVTWFVNNAAKIMSLVNSILDSITAIANGDLGGAAKYVEDSLAKAIPTVIGFLANLLGLGKITDKVKDIIKKVQAPINKAIDWVLNKAKEYATKFAKALGFGDKNKDKEQSEKEHEQMAREVIQTLEAQDTGGEALDEATVKANKQTKARELEQTYTAKLEPGVKMTINFKPEVDKGEDEELPFTVTIAPNDTVMNGAVPLKSSYIIDTGIVLNGSVLRQQTIAGAQQKILNDFRALQLGKGLGQNVTGSDLVRNRNYAMANIEVEGKTKSGLVVPFQLQVSQEQALTIFSSGDGAVTGEMIKVPIYIGTAGGGFEQKRAGQESGLPGLFAKANPRIVVSDQAELEDFIVNSLLPALMEQGEMNANAALAFNATRDKHSEQAVLQYLTMNDSNIARRIRDLDVHQITRLSVHIHTERTICPMCAAACNKVLGNLQGHLPETWEALKSRNNSGTPEVNGVITSNVQYGQRPANDSRSPIISTPPLGNNQSGNATAQDLANATEDSQW